ncbi:MAG: hypothetical protein A2231_11330 [Candidatus Firestonebacteria bacterium RIFOXYA2_FULL_40_8]|nr:MAG: hypothetical protein A2231_11330 [Candidatus Firestonebacteria bacterium RIFOXYA2_FULL_40_8]
MKKESKANYFRVPLTLPKELDVFLQKVGTEAKTSGGFKLPKTLIIRSLIRAMMELDVDVGGVKEEEELKSRILEALKKRK